ncbi:hypothetical protein PGT21_025480 [Puccinia graminis f. sp. tritici]|uniref:Uncharacterized protein n=1 Tax=Puccinia graminis f. sp. tritici TaxID=56615 RepID=A0A5B0P8Q4_PUCGR|nr:hypothetical protein PGT21_025480 [Puccinia graminis f. sp. tritici]KAA1117075.1 hypothetical protein PGTUg99_035177 [Puccinia graminis f. sp. tritici]
MRALPAFIIKCLFLLAPLASSNFAGERCKACKAYQVHRTSEAQPWTCAEFGFSKPGTQGCFNEAMCDRYNCYNCNTDEWRPRHHAVCDIHKDILPKELLVVNSPHPNGRFGANDPARGLEVETSRARNRLGYFLPGDQNPSEASASAPAPTRRRDAQGRYLPR